MPCPGIIFAGHVLPPDCWRYGRIRNRVLKRKNSALQSGRIASYSAGMNRIFTFWSCQSAPLSIQSRIFCMELWLKCGAAEAVLEKTLRKKNFLKRDGEHAGTGRCRMAVSRSPRCFFVSNVEGGGCRKRASRSRMRSGHRLRTKKPDDRFFLRSSGSYRLLVAGRVEYAI